MVSFFDSEYPEQSFDLISPSSINGSPVVFDSLNFINHTTNQNFSGLFGIHGSWLIKYDDITRRPVAEVDINYSRLNISSSKNIFLMKNEGTFELQFNNEATRDKWVDVLQNICVMTNFSERYSKLQTLSKGKTAKVSLVQSNRSGKFFAAKSYSKLNFPNSDSKASFFLNIHLLRTTQHPNLIHLYEVYETDNSIYLIVDLIQGMSLQDLLLKPSFKSDFTDNQIRNTFHVILECIAYLASQGIMHRDLKPSNIIIDKDGGVNLVDLDLATYIDMTSFVVKKCGSPGYIAPEIFYYKTNDHDTYYDTRCDVFSAGSILYFMLFGRPLYEAKSNGEIISLNKSFDYLDYRISDIQQQMRYSQSRIHQQGLDLLLLLLEPNHKIRVSAIEALQHSYLSSSKSKTFTRDAFANLTVSSSFDRSRIEMKARPNVHVYKGKENIVIQYSDSQQSPDISHNYFIKTDSAILNLSKSNSPQGNNKSSQFSPPLGNGSGSALSVRQSSSPLTNKTDPLNSGKNVNLQANHMVIKSSKFRNIKSNIKENDKENIGMNEKGLCSATHLAVEKFCVQTRARSDFTRTKTTAFLKESSSPEMNEEEEEESELSEDIEDEDSKIGFYIENLKNQEILKPEAKMSRYV